jgi:hypothetical protein
MRAASPRRTFAGPGIRVGASGDNPKHRRGRASVGIRAAPGSLVSLGPSRPSRGSADRQFWRGVTDRRGCSPSDPSKNPRVRIRSTFSAI